MVFLKPTLYHEVNSRHNVGRRFFLATKGSDGMPVALLLQRLVSEPCRYGEAVLSAVSLFIDRSPVVWVTASRFCLAWVIN